MRGHQRAFHAGGLGGWPFPLFYHDFPNRPSVSIHLTFIQSLSVGRNGTWASECSLPTSARLVVAPERSLDCCFLWDSPSCLTSVTPGRSTHTAVHKACGWPCGAVPIGCTFPPTSQPFKQFAKPLFFPPVFHHSRQLHY